MSTVITNGLGGIISLTDTAVTTTISSNFLNGLYIKFWNSGSSDAFVQVNVDDTDFTQGSALVVPAGESFPAFRDPTKKFTAACASGETTTLKWSAL